MRRGLHYWTYRCWCWRAKVLVILCGLPWCCLGAILQWDASSIMLGTPAFCVALLLVVLEHLGTELCTQVMAYKLMERQYIAVMWFIPLVKLIHIKHITASTCLPYW